MSLPAMLSATRRRVLTPLSTRTFYSRFVAAPLVLPRRAAKKGKTKVAASMAVDSLPRKCMRRGQVRGKVAGSTGGSKGMG